MYQIPLYPDSSEITLEARHDLHPLFKGLGSRISEFSFANIYLFRKTHGYRVSRIAHGQVIVTGIDGGKSFFMLPFGLPGSVTLKGLFERYAFMKCAAPEQAVLLQAMGYKAVEDRDNFDYIYSRAELISLKGRRFHKKKNLVNLFTGSYAHEVRPLLDEYISDALKVLDEWRALQRGPGDYGAAKEALDLCSKLELCGGIYYVEGSPSAYVLGEELNCNTFVIHFEKGAVDFKGLMQYVNQSFAALLPPKYVYINREQDLGDEGLKKAKESYRPVELVRKYRVFV